jgi:hypothetical protein
LNTGSLPALATKKTGVRSSRGCIGRRIFRPFMRRTTDVGEVAAQCRTVTRRRDRWASLDAASTRSAWCGFSGRQVGARHEDRRYRWQRLIGSRLVSIVRSRGHEVLAASPDSGVNTITGEGLPKALAGAQVVVDVANSPSFDDAAVLTFFETSGTNLLAAALDAVPRTHWPHCAIRRRRSQRSRLGCTLPALFQPILSADVVASVPS